MARSGLHKPSIAGLENYAVQWKLDILEGDAQGRRVIILTVITMIIILCPAFLSSPFSYNLIKTTRTRQQRRRWCETNTRCRSKTTGSKLCRHHRSLIAFAFPDGHWEGKTWRVNFLAKTTLYNEFCIRIFKYSPVEIAKRKAESLDLGKQFVGFITSLKSTKSSFFAFLTPFFSKS